MKTIENLSFRDLFYLFRKKFFNSKKKTFVKPDVSIAIWSGDYKTWDDAEDKCTGYDKMEILEKCQESILKVKNGIAVYERDSVLFDKVEYSWGLLAGLQKVVIENELNLKVLDYGGSLGSTYFQNRVFFSNLKNFKWGIVEQKHFVENGRKYFQDDFLKYYYTIEDCFKDFKPNVILLSSVIQYLKEPISFLDELNILKVSYVIFDRTSFIIGDSEKLTIQTVPNEIYEASYPCWFFNESNLISRLSNYDLLADFSSFCDADRIINNNEQVYWKGIIFKLK
jgi:putative methyltransferase (TIGR04325 family)